MGNPDMRTPIAHALAWPERIESGVASLDFLITNRLDFEAPDEQRFPALKLSAQAIKAGGIMPAVLNAANEIAVEAFLQGQIRFTEITRVTETVLNDVDNAEPIGLDVVIEADQRARTKALGVVSALGG